MRFKWENPRYTNYHGTYDDIHHGLLMFDLDITDLTGKINNGKPFPYTYIDNDVYNTDDIWYEISIQVPKILPEIALYELNPISAVNLEIYKYRAKCDIDEDYKIFTETYDSIWYINDIYAVNEKSVNILNNITSMYTNMLTNNMINEADIKHTIISLTNLKHDLTYKELIGLSAKLTKRFSDVKIYARNLKDKVNDAKSIEEVVTYKWDLLSTVA